MTRLWELQFPPVATVGLLVRTVESLLDETFHPSEVRTERTLNGLGHTFEVESEVPQSASATPHVSHCKTDLRDNSLLSTSGKRTTNRLRRYIKDYDIFGPEGTIDTVSLALKVNAITAGSSRRAFSKHWFICISAASDIKIIRWAHSLSPKEQATLYRWLWRSTLSLPEPRDGLSANIDSSAFQQPQKSNPHTLGSLYAELSFKKSWFLWRK